MTFNLIAHAGAAAASTPTTSAIDTSGADLLVVAAHIYSFSGSFPGTLSDSKGNTWTALTRRTQGQSSNCLFYAANPIVGSGHTFQIDEASVFASIEVQAWSGADSSPFDTENGVTQPSSATSVQPGSVTAADANSLFVTAVGTDEAGGDPGSPFTVDGSFSITDQNPFVGGVNVGGRMAYKVGTGSENPTWSWPAANPAAAAIAVFSPAADAQAPALMGQGVM